MSESRIANSMRNFTAGAVGQIFILALGFVSRTVFVRTLGAQYLGLNGLFSNIIYMLSLTELGVGTAITFNMYKPIAEKDENKVYMLMKFYKTMYRLIGTIITVIGLTLLPFLPHLIKNPPTFVNYYVIFILFLLQTASSYFFFAYKSTLIRAHQKTYVITIMGCYFTIGTAVMQIVCLYVFKNYYIYLTILIVSNLFKNYIIAKKSEKMYPYIKEKRDEKLSKGEMKEILKNCFSLSIYKVNRVVLNATDNIILSKFIGLGVVGLYSNYTLITSTLRGLLNLIFESLTASIGNLHALKDEDPEKEVEIFFSMNFLAVLLFGILSIGIAVVSNPFITIWLGNDYLLSSNFVLLISFNLYMSGLQQITTVFRTALGLFQQMKYRPLFGAIINLVVSLALVRPLGIEGVIIGTVVSGLLTYTWFDPIIIFKVGFGKNVWAYYKKNILYLMVHLFSFAITFKLSQMVHLQGFLYVLVLGLLSTLIPGVTFTLCFFRTPEFKYLRSIAIINIGKIRKLAKKKA